MLAVEDVSGIAIARRIDGVASTSDRDRRTFYTNITRYRDFIRSVAGV